MKPSIAIIFTLCLLFALWNFTLEESTQVRKNIPFTSSVDDQEVYHDLFKRFNKHLQDPEAYAQDVKRFALSFPEGSLFALNFPAFAYANYALMHPEQAKLCQENISILISIAEEEWVRLNIDYPMHENIVDLKQWNQHGVFIGHVGLMLCSYKLAGGDGRYDPLMHKVYQLLLNGFQQDGQGRWLHSYPQRTWVFDSIPCILYMAVYEEFFPQDHPKAKSILQQYSAYREKVAQHDSLPFINSEIHMENGEIYVGPRGCEIAGTIAFYAHLAPKACKPLYEDFKKHFWRSTQVSGLEIHGFREWPEGTKGFEDMDTGPILFEIGPSASAFGMAAARITSDLESYQRIKHSLNHFTTLIRTGETLGLKSMTSLAGLDLGIHEKYKYGFLIGDATMFYVSTWMPWCQALE